MADLLLPVYPNKGPLSRTNPLCQCLAPGRPGARLGRMARKKVKGAQRSYLGVTIPEEVYSRLRMLAARENRTASGQALRAIMLYLDHQADIEALDRKSPPSGH